MDVCSDVTRLQPTPKSSLDDPKWVLEQTTFKAWSFFLLDFRNDLMTLCVEDFENLIPLAFRKCKYQWKVAKKRQKIEIDSKFRTVVFVVLFCRRRHKTRNPESALQQPFSL